MTRRSALPSCRSCSSWSRRSRPPPWWWPPRRPQPLSREHPRSLSRALSYPHFAHGLELDVRLSADGVVYVFHDEDGERLIGVSGGVESRSSEEIDRLRVSGETIPRLSQVIDSCLSLTPEGESRVLNVEVKMPRDPARMISALRPLLDPLVNDPRVALVVSSFDPRVLAQAIEQQAPWRLALLYESWICWPAWTGWRPLYPLIFIQQSLWSRPSIWRPMRTRRAGPSRGAHLDRR